MYCTFTFNSGIMLINVAQWLKNTVTEQVLSFLSNPSVKVSFPDQDALNVVLEKTKLLLPKRWNHILEDDMYNEIPADTIFLHCTVRPKPWEIACDTKSPAHRYYVHYENLSPWAGMPLLQPSTPTDARIYARKLFAERNIYLAVFWYSNYLRMKLK